MEISNNDVSHMSNWLTYDFRDFGRKKCWQRVWHTHRLWVSYCYISNWWFYETQWVTL